MPDYDALGGYSADQLRGFVASIEDLEKRIRSKPPASEADEINADKKKVYHQIRACGFHVKALKIVLARRRLSRSKLEDEDRLVALYDEVLSVRPRE